jgi:hypothetical protein
MGEWGGMKGLWENEAGTADLGVGESVPLRTVGGVQWNVAAFEAEVRQAGAGNSIQAGLVRPHSAVAPSPRRRRRRPRATGAF